MAHYSFTATSFNDFFNQYKSHMVAEGWVLEDEKITNTSTMETRHVVFRNPLDEFSAGIESNTLIKYLNYGLNSVKVFEGKEYFRSNVARVWNPSELFTSQSGSAVNSIVQSLSKDNSNLKCHVNITNQRVLLTIFNENYTFSNIFMGNFKPFGDSISQEYTRFNCIGANQTVDAYEQGRFWFDGSYRPSPDRLTKRFFFSSGDLLRNVDNTVSLFEDVIYYSGYAIGAVDGLYFLTGDRVDSEQTFSIGLDEYIVLPLVFKTNNLKRFYAVKTN